MLDSGALTKYLLYAIGEIALVVVGILIALQINNWNIDRLNRISEREGLARIVQDLEKDLQDLSLSQRTDDLRLLRGVQVLEALNVNASRIKTWKAYEIAKNNLINEDSPEERSFGELLMSLRIYFLFEESNATFQEFLSTGKLDMIRDVELRASIQSYYTRLERQTSHQDLLQKNRNELVRYLQKDGISAMNRMDLEQVMNQIEDKEQLVAIIENVLDGTRLNYDRLILREGSLQQDWTKALIDRIERYLE